jgi:hypothetical protein
LLAVANFEEVYLSNVVEQVSPKFIYNASYICPE